MILQALDSKGQHFLELLDEDLNPIEPSSSKEGLWLKFFGHYNLLCARALRTIVNHASIGKYWLRFFPKEESKCPCRLYPIETRWHILHECRRYNNYWNPRRDTMAHFTLFLEFNSSAFSLLSQFALHFLLVSFTPFSLFILFSFSFRVSCCVHLNVCSYKSSYHSLPSRPA